ncbi:SDR family oxidoreductase [Micromonospora musae]|uniref:SDR family oxidoreductase n=1 Tax=Micromonospora musae TaxID=1894970 RepID=A0ABX9QYG6_9ACTN|nr:SDR family oxidoreductase [Micromonospora musae]RKN15678.1 SDR family oxidoreductase [Micromonospora musae]
MGRVDGRVAIVTGGARGMGAAIVRAFAAEGAKVVIADILDAEGQALEAELGDRTRYRHLDITDHARWQELVRETEEQLGPLSILVNNAAVQLPGTIVDQDPDTFRKVLDVNLYGTWLGMHNAVPALRRAGGGVVVNISSLAGLAGFERLGAYVASKWGVRGLTKTAALELARDNIRAVSVHPGPIRTPMHPPAADPMLAALPIPRIGEPEEVASMVLFLVAEATFSTGSEFVIDGGAAIGGPGQSPVGNG